METALAYVVALFTRPFNSLSRDHPFPTDDPTTTSGPFNSLSRDHSGVLAGTLSSTTYSTFNSLSRDHSAFARGAGAAGKPIFQLPLSGSRRSKALRQNTKRGTKKLSTPSLGITIFYWFGDLSYRELSTPSLGITEPDSGIFGLSAAFCRGTSSHK